MLNYLNNNLALIEEIQDLYEEGINIDNIVQKFKTEEIVKHNAFDYGRFRVFIDSCMLLLNREKLNQYCKDKYNYKGFLDEIDNDLELKGYLNFVKSEKITSSIEGKYLYYSLEEEQKTPWNQVAIIRNAMAHMQYGNFVSQSKSGIMLYYFLYNKDKGIRKDSGIVLEPILHTFIQAFFSNYSYGMPFKNTFFSRYSIEKRKKTWRYRFYEITYKDEKMEKYNGYNVNLMSELIQVSKDYKKVINFLDRYIEKFNIKETCVHELVDGCKYKKLAKRFKLKGKEEYIYGLKVILDFETELSNFLVHIGQLNEVFYKYCSMRECGQYSNSELKEYQIQFEEKLLELKEDENARLAFELGFLYLKIINFVLRTEDDDYTKLDYSKVDVTMFEYKSEEMLKYASSNRIEENKIQHYVIERMRNALMHGHISIDITENGEPVFSFTDIYNKREELIEISFDNLKLFLEQDSLYSGISTKTDLLFGISLN